MFASKKEANRYVELKLLQRVGAIRSLETHPAFDLSINGEPLLTPSNRKIRYEADFEYEEKVGAEWCRVIEDCKGYMNKGDPTYRLFALKAALVRVLHGVTVRIT